jgi:hypothetical protein
MRCFNNQTSSTDQQVYFRLYPDPADKKAKPRAVGEEAARLRELRRKREDYEASKALQADIDWLGMEGEV